MSLFENLGQFWSRKSPSKKSAARRHHRKDHSKRGLLFEGLEERSMLAITQIALGDFSAPRVQDFQAVPTGPIASNAAAFQAIGISSITGTSDADVDSYSTASPAANRSLAATSTGLRVIDPNSGDANDRFGNNNSYTINFAQPQTRFGFTNDDSGGQSFTFNIVLFSGGTQVDSGTLPAPIFGRNGLYFSSTIAFDSVRISNSFGDGFVIDNLTTETPAPTITAPTSITVVEDIASPLTGISFTAGGTGSVTASFSVPSGTLTATSGGSVTVGGSGSAALTLDGTVANINTFLAASNLRFQTALNATASVTLTVGINDNGITGGTAQTASKTVTLNVDARNDNPVNTLPFLSTNEDTPVDVTGFSISDVDSTGPFSVNVRFNNTAAGILTFRTDVPGGLTSSNILNNGTPNLTISGASLAAINTTLSATHGLVYTPATNFNGFALFAVDTNSDGNGGSDVGDTSTWNVTAVNDAPVNTVLSNLSIITDILTAVPGVSIFDADAGASSISVTLNAQHGTLSVRNNVSNGVTAANITGNGSATVTINAPLALINQTLADSIGLRYLSDFGYAGPDTITITTSDLGNTGSGGIQTDVDTIALTVGPANQRPTITVPASLSATVGLASPLTGISFADADAGTGSVTATISTAGGSLTATSGGNVSVSGSGSGSVTLAGSIDDINTFISGSNLRFTGPSTGSITLFVAINDNGNTGIGGPQLNSDSSVINVQALPTLSINDRGGPEGIGTLTFTVNLSYALAQQVTVNYTTANGSAVSPADYTVKSGTLTFAPGETEQTISISIFDDFLDEDNETFFVNLSNPTNATIADNQGLGTIGNNDGAPTVVVSNPTANEGDGSVTFTLTLTGASGKTVTADYQTSDISATAGSDYTAKSGTLTFLPGETQHTVTVLLTDDALPEGSEQFRLTVVSGQNLSAGQNLRGTATITDNDTPPTVTSPTATNITSSFVTLGGNVTADNGAPILERGFLIAATSINNNPQLNGPGVTKVPVAGTTGAFTADLSPARTTQYSYVAFATNAAGTTYSTVETFTTPADLATLTTPQAANMTSTSARISGGLTNTGGSNVTSFGYVYAKTADDPTPQLGEANVTQVAVVTTSITINSVFVGNLLSGLQPATQYSLATYAINSVGNSYSSTITFTTLAAAPTVTTPTQTNITSNSATLGGNVTTDNGAAITERGILLAKTSVNNNPQLNGNGVTKIVATGTTGVFTVDATGLDPAAGYSYVAFATNSIGTTYTTVGSFTTIGVAPTVTSPTATNVAVTTATLGGNVASDGQVAITERGIVYAITSINGNPQLNGNGVTKVTTTGTTGVFTIDVTGIPSGKQISFAAYATNALGTSYSTVGMFTTAPAVGQLGGVTVQVIGNQLVITGDNKPDRLSLTGTANANEFILKGLYGTVVNGVVNNTVTSQGITSIQWNLTNGGDLIVIDNANVAGNVTIGGGSGANGIALGSLGPVRVGGNLAIDGGLSNGSIVVNRTTTVGGMSIIGGLGSGQNSITTSNSTIGTNLSIIGGPGADQIQQTQVTVNGLWNVNASSGNDVISIDGCIALGTATFNSGLGTDIIGVNGGRFDAGLTLDGSAGGGVKRLSMSSVVYTGTATLRGGEQNDLVVFSANLGGTAVFDMAGGHDSVLVQYSILDELFAALGDGNDIFNLRGNRLKGLASLDGGPGTNTLINIGNIFQGPLQRNRI